MIFGIVGVHDAAEPMINQDAEPHYGVIFDRHARRFCQAPTRMGFLVHSRPLTATDVRSASRAANMPGELDIHLTKVCISFATKACIICLCSRGPRPSTTGINKVGPSRE